ncbi:MAG TPA: response regulator [Oscillatoriaceae cyanobacterium M33_DOE_052]|nr:response regulator [Oscillatoriaceae cyanobacterium M33_DOE_052]
MPKIKPTVFVVDDDQDTLEAMSEILEDFGGYEVRVAKTGQLAIESIQKVLPDLILLDMKMDDMTGEQIYQILQENPLTCHIPVIFVTGFDKPENVCKSWNPSVMYSITKPFTLDDFLAKIKNRLVLGHQN